MEIALQSNMIVIRTHRNALNKAWVRSFIETIPDELLFLSHSMIIYDNEDQRDEKELFLREVCKVFAQKESLSEDFFIKAMLSCLHYPIKIETKASQYKGKALEIEVKASDHGIIEMKLSERDWWFNLYVQSKLHESIVEIDDEAIVFELHNSRHVSQFERALGRNFIFSKKILFHYEHHFLRTLFQDYQSYETRLQDKYYAVLGVSKDASKDELKSSYKQLVKTYHPDQVMHLNDEREIVRFTRKFQQVQEAYQMLKGA